MAKHYPGAKGRGTKSPPFVQVFHHLIDSENYRSLSPRAVKLLIDVLRFYNRRNNGDLAITPKLMKPMGWTSNDQLAKATIELEHYGFLKKSRQGGRHVCNLFAVTFYPVNECDGKHELTPSKIPTNEWQEAQPNKPQFKKSLSRRTGNIDPPHGAKRGSKAVELTRHTGQSGQKQPFY